MSREQTPAERIRCSTVTTFRKKLWRPFIHAIKTYHLIQPGDRIAVCISGGKDSMLMAVLFKELQPHSEIPFEVVNLCMDPGYAQQNRAAIVSNAELLDLPLTFYENRIFDVTATTPKNPCYLCARMRRGSLYEHAQKLGCNKIALGHHFNDVTETIMMSMFYAGQIQSMPPRLDSKNFPGMQLIRPLYEIHEEDIIEWQQTHGLRFLQCACRLTEAAAVQGNDHVSKRKEIKTLLHALELQNPDVQKNIFNSLHNLDLDTMVGWRSANETHTFLERFNTEVND